MKNYPTCKGVLGLNDLFTFNAVITVSWCFFTASWENSEVANKHMPSKARYLKTKEQQTFIVLFRLNTAFNMFLHDFSLVKLSA